MSLATRWTLTLAASTLLFGGSLAGCSGEDDDDNGNSPTPAPTATPEPTPPTTLEGQYRTTSFAIAPNGVGFDLDGSEVGGDPEPDNNLPVVFDTLYVELEATIYEVLLAATEDAERAATLTATIMTGLENAGLILNVDDLNASIDAAIKSGALIYLESLTGTPDDATLTWFDGVKNQSGGYFTNYEVGAQAGAVDLASGDGSVGPGTFRYEFSQTLALNVSNTLATFDYTHPAEGAAPAGLTNGLLGGVILLSEIENLIRTIIPAAVSEEDENTIVSAVTELVLPFMDVTIGGNPAFSVAFSFATEHQVFVVAE